MIEKCIEFDAGLLDRWDDYVLKHPSSSIYHTASWLNIISEVFKYKNCSILAVNEKDEVCGVMPLFQARLGFNKVLITMPLRDRGGILANDQFSADLLVKNAITKMNLFSCDALIIKQYDLFQWNVLPELLLQKPLVTSFVALNRDKSEIWNKITPKAKNKVRQAERNDVRVIFSDQKTDLDLFYNMFYRLRRQLGVPPFPKSFFEKIYVEIIKRGRGVIGVAWHNEKPSAAMILFAFGKSVIDAYSAWDREQCGLRANDLLVWKAIEWSKNNHYETFEFGADSPDQAALLKYKGKWSAEIKDVNYYVAYRKKAKINLFNAGNLSLGLLRKAISFVPASLYNLSGKITPRLYC